LLDSITRPNGIAITPDQQTLIIANSDSTKPYWYAYDFGAGGKLIHPRIFYDVTAASKLEKGLPDGLKIDSKGNVFATGPGGVWIFNKNGKLLGKIKFDGVTSNCSLSADEKTIYITADMYVLRVKMKP
jgi:gluconolactonase